MVDIVALSSPSPAPSSSGSSSSAGASSSAAAGGVGAGSNSVAANGAIDATRDDIGTAHPFAELLASLAGPTSQSVADAATASTSGDATASSEPSIGDGQPSDALYAMAGLCMAAMPATPLVTTSAVTSPTSQGTFVETVSVPSGTAATIAHSIGERSADALSPPDVDTGAAPVVTGAADVLGGSRDATSPSVDGAAASAVTDPTAQMPLAATTPTPMLGEAPAQLLTAAATATTASMQTGTSPATSVDTKTAGKGRARSMTSDKASTDATMVDTDDAASSTVTSPTMTPTAPSASLPAHGDPTSGGGSGRDHQRAASQLTESLSTVSTTSASMSSGANASASTASIGSAAGAAGSQAQPWEQVLAVLRPTRRFTDGSHRLSIQMTPDDLGTVTIELSMDRGRLSMHMLTETQGAADALRSSLHELRADLEGSGQRTGSFEVAQQWAQHRQNQSEFARAARFGGLDSNSQISTVAVPVAAIDLTTSAGTVSDGRLDVRI